MVTERSEIDLDPMRAFVALELDARVRQGLTDAQSELARSGADVRWVTPDNLHLTLVFLGDIEPGQVQPMAGVMDGAAGACPPFALAVAGMGFFGSPRSPRVIWAGLREDTGRLDGLREQLIAGMRRIGLSPDSKPFTPHLTIGRPRSARGVERLLRAVDRAQDRSFGQVEVRRIVLMRSELLPAGPRYSMLHASALAPGSPG